MQEKSAIQLCSERIVETVEAIARIEYSRKMGRVLDDIAVLERLNELKIRLHNLENRLEELYGLDYSDDEMDKNYLDTQQTLFSWVEL